MTGPGQAGRDSRLAALGLVLCAFFALGVRFAAPMLPSSGDGREVAVYALKDDDFYWSDEGGRDGWVVDEAGRRLRPVEGWRGMLLGRPLDLNQADAVDLEALPGVGRKTAEKILAARLRLKGFNTPEDLCEVSGLGEKKLDALRPWVRAERTKTF
jgi:hypothetical protein